MVAIHACGALMMIYKFCPWTRFRLDAARAAAAILHTYGNAAGSRTDSPDTPPLTAEVAGTSESGDNVGADPHLLSIACSMLWALFEDKDKDIDRGALAAAVRPVVQVLWDHMEPGTLIDTNVITGSSAGLGMRAGSPQGQLEVTEAAWRVLSALNDETLSPQGWGGVQERREVLLRATRALAAYPDAAGLAQVRAV
jgi:hypothetical protein